MGSQGPPPLNSIFSLTSELHYGFPTLWPSHVWPLSGPARPVILSGSQPCIMWWQVLSQKRAILNLDWGLMHRT